MYVRASSIHYCATSVIFRGYKMVKMFLSVHFLLNGCAGFVIQYRKFNLVMYTFLYVKSLLSSRTFI